MTRVPCEHLLTLPAPKFYDGLNHRHHQLLKSNVFTVADYQTLNCSEFRRPFKPRPVSSGDRQRIHSGLFWGDGELQIVTLLFSLILWLSSPFEVKVYTLLNEKSLIFESGGC